MKSPIDNRSWTDGIFEEPVSVAFEQATKELVEDLFEKGYSRFEIQCLMETMTTQAVLFKVLQ